MSILQLPTTSSSPPPTSPPSGASPPVHPPDAHFASVLDEHRARTALAEGPTKRDADDAPATPHGPAGKGAQAPATSAPASKQAGDEETATATVVALVSPTPAAPATPAASLPANAPVVSTPAEEGVALVAPAQAGQSLPGAVPAIGASSAQPANAPVAPAPADVAQTMSATAGPSGADAAATPSAPVANPGTAPLVAAVPAGTQAVSVPHPAAAVKPAAPAAGHAAQPATPATPATQAAPAQPGHPTHAPATSDAGRILMSAPASAPSAPAAAPAPVPDAPAASAAPTSVPERAVGLDRAVETVRLALRAAAERGVTQARISLNPRELGGIHVHLRHTADGLVARVVAEHGHAAQLLEQAGAELRRSLETQGVTLLRLDIGTHGEQGGRAAGQQAGFGASGNGARANAGGADAGTPDDGDAVPGSVSDASPSTQLALPNGVLIDVLA